MTNCTVNSGPVLWSRHTFTNVCCFYMKAVRSNDAAVYCLYPTYKEPAIK